MEADVAKFTKMEERAREMCAVIRVGLCEAVTVEWVRNATWGMCPRIEWRGAVASRATGCGYCKESSVLADALRHLATDEAGMVRVSRTAGAGPEAVAKALESIGWIMRRIASTKTTDTYKLERAVAVRVIAGEEAGQ